MKKIIQLADLQKELMTEFYGYCKTRVVFTKKERDEFWNVEKKEGLTAQVLKQINAVCPALCHQIKNHRNEHKNIQSAVFSECVYAQTFANIFGLTTFVNCFESGNFLSEGIITFLSSYSLIPRYVYSNVKKSRMLIQAGGCGGIDSALITVINYKIFTIEFKEPYAKTSEPDLPKYKENGKLVVTKDFIARYPQFEKMLAEQQNLNFFKVIGSNVHDFSATSINFAVRNNYVKKYADVVCTEDKEGYLTMLPTNQLQLWGGIEGEIRPAGRNHYAVFTPKALQKFLLQSGAVIRNEKVTLPKCVLKIAKERGGETISRYKINSLFFVYAENCVVTQTKIIFNISDVRQLNPTITAKVNFKRLKYNDVKIHYKKMF